jgi:hypothetical protein
MPPPSKQRLISLLGNTVRCGQHGIQLGTLRERLHAVELLSRHCYLQECPEPEWLIPLTQKQQQQHVLQAWPMTNAIMQL